MRRGHDGIARQCRCGRPGSGYGPDRTFSPEERMGRLGWRMGGYGTGMARSLGPGRGEKADEEEEG